MGWSGGNACIYERTFALTCRGVVEPLLDAVADRLRLEGSEVLDVGSGTGRLAAAATRRGAVVTAVDPDPAMIRVAQRLRPDAASRWLVAGAPTFPSPTRASTWSPSPSSSTTSRRPWPRFVTARGCCDQVAFGDRGLGRLGSRRSVGRRPRGTRGGPPAHPAAAAGRGLRPHRRRARRVVRTRRPDGARTVAARVDGADLRGRTLAGPARGAGEDRAAGRRPDACRAGGDAGGAAVACQACRVVGVPHRSPVRPGRARPRQRLIASRGRRIHDTPSRVAPS